MAVIFICIGVTTVLICIIVLHETRWSKAKKEIKSSINKSNLIDYNNYIMTRTEKVKYTAFAALLLFAAGYVFFRNIYLCIALSTVSFIFPVMARKHLIKKRKNNLNMQFKDALNSVSSSLAAGRSVEESFKASLGDLKVLYLDEDTFIIKELELINRKIDMNETIEEALEEFAKRTGLDDITNFTDVFRICKSTGGNLVEVIKNTSNIINQKIEIKNEIDVQIAEQKLSQKVLNIMPFGLLILITLSSPDYVQPLYSASGNVVMMVVLLLLVLSYFIGAKIMDIKV